MTRNQNLDFLKIIACIMVVIIHVSGNYVINCEPSSSYYQIGYFWNSITRTAVPVFVMISGSFLLDSQRTSWKMNSAKTWKTIIIPTIIWTLVALLFLVLFENHSLTMIIGAMKSIVLGYAPYYHLWYMYMIIPLYLSVPLLIRVKRRLSFKQFVSLAICFLIGGWILNVNDSYFRMLFGGIEWLRGIQYLGYFMLGNVLITWFKQMTWSKKAVVLNSTVIFLVATVAILLLGTNQPLAMPVIIASISLFTIVANLGYQFERLKLMKTAKYTFMIYLVHAFVWGLITWFETIVVGNEFLFNPLWYIPVMTIIVLTMSLAFAVGVAKLKQISLR
ncbi:MAG: acyltransferase [Culicoidibacterales bacterium]